MQPASTLAKRILVPIDMSERSLKALEYAQDISNESLAEIVILRVLDDENPSRPVTEKKEAPGSDMSARKALVHLLMDRNIISQNVQIEIRHGTPDQEIVRAATDLHADVIILSTHGRTAAEEVPVGSVAEKVLRSSPVPVLTVKSDRFQSGNGISP